MSEIELDLAKLKDLNYTEAVYVPYYRKSNTLKELPPTRLDKIKRFFRLKVKTRYVYPIEVYTKVVRAQKLFSIETFQIMNDGDIFTWGEEGNEKEYEIFNAQVIPFRPEFMFDGKEPTFCGLTRKQWNETPLQFYQVKEKHGNS